MVASISAAGTFQMRTCAVLFAWLQYLKLCLMLSVRAFVNVHVNETEQAGVSCNSKLKLDCDRWNMCSE